MLQVFRFESKEVRFVGTADDPAWIGKDACAALGISKYRDALGDLAEDERVSVVVDTLGGRQSMTAVNEAGLYQLVLKAPIEIAKPFTRWLTHDVLPSLRRVEIPAAKNFKSLAGFVYLAHAKTMGFYKIGASKELYRRMAVLYAGTPLEMILLHRVFSFKSTLLEKMLYSYYDAYRMRDEWSCVRGERFCFSSEIAREFPMTVYQLDSHQLDSQLELARLPVNA